MCAMAMAANTDGREIRDKKRKTNLVGARRIPIIGTVWITRPCSNFFSRALATIGQRSMAKPLRVSTDPTRYSGSLRAAMRKNNRSSEWAGTHTLAGCMSMRTTTCHLSIQICASNTWSLRARAVPIRSMGYLSSESWPRITSSWLPHPRRTSPSPLSEAAWAYGLCPAVCRWYDLVRTRRVGVLVVLRLILEWSCKHLHQLFERLEIGS